MNHQAHRIGGICATTVATTILYNQTLGETSTHIAMGIAIAGGAIGALIPDIDHPSSKVGKKVKPVSVVINQVFGHRGFTHTILAFLLFVLGLFLLVGVIPVAYQGYYFPFALGLMIGYASHLVLDMMTVSGVPLLYPFSNHSFRIAKFRTGRDDLLVIVLMLMGTGFYLYFSGIL